VREEVLAERRILVVEDHPTQRELLRALLELHGFVVRETSSAREALALLEEFRPDVLLTDQVMPGMDGCELIRRIRSEPRWRGLPILLCTGVEGDPRSVFSEGDGVHLVVKPFAGDALVSRVREVLGDPRPTKTSERERRDASS
jgi:CheY-like chemotaxis protein